MWPLERQGIQSVDCLPCVLLWVTIRLSSQPCEQSFSLPSLSISLSVSTSLCVYVHLSLSFSLSLVCLSLSLFSSLSLCVSVSVCHVCQSVCHFLSLPPLSSPFLSSLLFLSPSDIFTFLWRPLAIISSISTWRQQHCITTAISQKPSRYFSLVVY